MEPRIASGSSRLREAAQTGRLAKGKDAKPRIEVRKHQLISKDMLTFSSCKIVFQVTIQRLTFGAEMLLLRKAVSRKQWMTILHLLKKSMCF